MNKMRYKIERMSKTERAKMALFDKCYHEIVKCGDSGGAECIHCHPTQSGAVRAWDWYCPDSPDHVCHYFSKTDKSGNKYVVSINGEKIILKGYNPYRESDDWCIFCGNPDERK